MRSLYPSMFVNPADAPNQHRFVYCLSSPVSAGPLYLPTQISHFESSHTPYLPLSGMIGIGWKASRIGERLSPYVGAVCVIIRDAN